MRAYFKKQIAIPQDHGSWVFILSPLLIGIFAGAGFSFETFILTVALMSAFLIRQPLTILVKISSGRRPKTDLHAALFWSLVYSSIVSLTIFGLFLKGFGEILFLAIPGLPIFIWHLWLVSKREERKQVYVEILGTGVLALAAPAAYWIETHTYNSTGWWLWILCWLQNSASIQHAYLRLEQRDWKSIPDRGIRFQGGRRVFFQTSFNLISTAILGLGTGILPPLIFIPYLSQWLESLWGIDRPAIGAKPIQIGIRQLIISTLWTILFIIFWRVK
ncbi:MAG TPA: YwiC-like family protein [Anaerolineales bacterium]|nr:YwiC-like family protein [Anaerolineales bacterium]